MALTDGAARERIAAQDLAALRSAGVLVEDPRRERPRYFDGRFLAARDLIRDQQYFLTREADLGQAAGSGVALGLFVRQGTEAQSLAISPGHGVTPAGELVLLPRQVVVSLANIPGGGAAVGPVRPVASAAAAHAQPHGAVRAGSPAGRVHRQSDRRLSRPASPASARSRTATSSKARRSCWCRGGTMAATDALEARRGRAAHAIFVERQRARRVGERAAARDDRAAEQHRRVDRRADGAARAGRRSRRSAGARLLAAGAEARATSCSTRRTSPMSCGWPARAPSPPPRASRRCPPPAACRPARSTPADFTQSYFPAEIDADFSIIPGRRAARAARGRAGAAADRSHASRRSARLHRRRDPRAGAAQRVARGRRPA